MRFLILLLQRYCPIEFIPRDYSIIHAGHQPSMSRQMWPKIRPTGYSLSEKTRTESTEVSER
jgi:hypothetical protein